MFGLRRNPVEFQIHKSVSGIARSRYPSGILSTRNNREISMLKRLANTHAEEIVYTEVEVIVDEVIEDLPFETIKKRVLKLDKWFFGITKDEMIMILRAERAADPENSTIPEGYNESENAEQEGACSIA